MSFDLLAPHYRWMEAVLAGGKLQRCRIAFLNEVKLSRRALILGEGNGRFLSALLQVNPSVRVTCVDGSARMLEQTRARLHRKGLSAATVEFVQADAMIWTPPAPGFDLLVTHFFLDCFRPEQIEEIAGRLRRVAAPDARWLLADFCEPSAGPARWRARFILALMYGFFRFTTGLPAKRLAQPDPFIQQQGFELRARHQAEWGLLHSDLWVLRKNSARTVAQDSSVEPPCFSTGFAMPARC